MSRDREQIKEAGSGGLRFWGATLEQKSGIFLDINSNYFYLYSIFEINFNKI